MMERIEASKEAVVSVGWQPRATSRTATRDAVGSDLNGAGVILLATVNLSNRTIKSHNRTRTVYSTRNRLPLAHNRVRIFASDVSRRLIATLTILVLIYKVT